MITKSLAKKEKEKNTHKLSLFPYIKEHSSFTKFMHEII